MLVEIAFVAVLDHQVDVIGGLLDVIEFDDVVIVAALKDLDLIFKEFVELSLKLFSRDAFYGDVHFGYLVVALVDLAELALSNDSFEHVVFDYLDHCLYIFRRQILGGFFKAYFRGLHLISDGVWGLGYRNCVV